MAVTPHHYSLPLRSIVKQGYSHSVQTPDRVETSTLWLTGNLRVCSLSSWDPTSLPTQVPTSLLPSLPAHQKIHTHTSIIFSPFDVYFIRSHQFTMLVWESVFSWLAISMKAHLWRHNSKPLTFSIQLLAAQPVLLQGLSFWGGWAYLLLWFCLLLWLRLIFWYPFQLYQFLRCTGTEKTVWFSCCLHLLRLHGIWSDFLSQGSFHLFLILFYI